LGGRVTTTDAPYLELEADVRRRYNRKPKQAPTQQGKVNKQTNADIALMARMGTIHNPNEM
jgi:hypothetical protein